METLIGRGRLRNAVTALIIPPVAMAFVGFVFAISLSIGDSQSTPWTAVVFMVLGLAAGCSVTLIMILLWVPSAARVSYYARGSNIIVRRGRRIVASVDASAVGRVEVVGLATTRRFFLGFGTFWSVLSDLPIVVYADSEDPSSVLTGSLPSILIVGRSDLDAFKAALSGALLDGGVERRKLATLIS